MAIQCPQCGAEYDVTLFEFGHRVRCDCGAWVDLAVGHRQFNESRESAPEHGDSPLPADRSEARRSQQSGSSKA